MKKASEEKKKEIVQYCRNVMQRLKLDYLKKTGIFKNEFLEFLYIHALGQYESEGSYELTDENITVLFSIKKQTEISLDKIKNKEIIINAIDEEDNIIASKKTKRNK